MLQMLQYNDIIICMCGAPTEHTMTENNSVMFNGKTKSSAYSIRKLDMIIENNYINYRVIISSPLL